MGDLLSDIPVPSEIPTGRLTSCSCVEERELAGGSAAEGLLRGGRAGEGESRGAKKLFDDEWVMIFDTQGFPVLFPRLFWRCTCLFTYPTFGGSRKGGETR